MYSLDKAAQYWGDERLAVATNPIEAVAGLARPSYINDGYTNWEVKILEKILLKYNNIENVIDLACGVGRFTVPLAKNSHIKKIYAIDIAQGMLDICKDSLANANLIDKAEFLCADSTGISLPPCSINAVVCLGLLEHLPLELQLKTLEKINDLLCYKGVLVLEINNINSILLNNNKDNIFRKSSQLENGYFCGLISDKEILKKIDQLGMKIIAKYCNPFFSLVSHLLRQINNDNVTDNKIGKKWIDMAGLLDEMDEQEIASTISDQIIFEIIKL